MAENSAIEWTHATFNPWLGCTKLSAACDNCYAEPLVVCRLGGAWGSGAPRRRTAASTWKAPLSWDRKAAKEGRRMRVFCASLADVFDAEVPDAWRDDLFGLICSTPHLDWLLLTKRPAVARKYLGDQDRIGAAWCDATHKVLGGADPGPAPQWPLPNVWLGTTVEDQKMADLRIPLLLETPAAVRFLSMEPLLGPVSIPGLYPVGEDGIVTTPALDWVIAGGESGPGARPTHPDWFRSVRDQCAEAGVPFLFKQHGDWVSSAEIGFAGHEHRPAITMAPYEMMRVGKKAAGRHLDGVLHDSYPVVG
ncbi:protein gp37 [Azospirillum agricola]|uniref:phage Gp37/Gp68 family protein n=1 Tax=Azospirillum agricola TaxID=1720247 RepID=UPI001AEB649A|nr:phage Gp37/Gp68 family protein [Azospirillum agricola]MBP2232544.1 protein gp37 [Azospirillum agricola]